MQGTSTSSSSVQSLWQIEQRAPAVVVDMCVCTLARYKKCLTGSSADKPARRVHRSVKFTIHGIVRHVIRYGFLLVCRSQWSSGSMSDCSARGPALWAVVFIAQPLRFTALGTGCVHHSCSA